MEPEGGEDVVPVVEAFNEGRHARHKDKNDQKHYNEEAVEAVNLSSVHLALPRQKTFQPLMVPVPVGRH